MPTDWLTALGIRVPAERKFSKRLGSRYRSGRSQDWLKNPEAPAVKREAEKNWGK